MPPERQSYTEMHPKNTNLRSGVYYLSHVLRMLSRITCLGNAKPLFHRTSELQLSLLT
jgi:hypothetical protein